uniref:Rieske domain-containing protein n=1 Tax=viral metagenome TaxID=1070528 RepID=A0A6C0I170_9ZZZZ
MNLRIFCIINLFFYTQSFPNFFRNIFHKFDSSFFNSIDIDLKSLLIEPSLVDMPCNETNFNLNWYVIGESSTFLKNKIHKITVWDKDYVVWKDQKTSEIYAMDDDCSHKGTALSGGYLQNSCIVCPYHGYEFSGNGTLIKIPGLNFTSSPCKHQKDYHVVEKNGWVFLNTISKKDYFCDRIDIFEESEAHNPDFSAIFLNVQFKSYGRIVSENSLDVMHIGYVHSFGNREFPSPLKEIPPFAVSPFHYRTEYDYLSGRQSFAKRIFGVNQLKIQNEFALPHFTIARILFGPFISTVVTFATPVNITHTNLYVKTYRNFWRGPINSVNPLDKIFNSLGNFITKRMMYETIMQDKGVVENIKLEHMDGKFNMKYDKLSNTYRTLYKNWIHKIL